MEWDGNRRLQPTKIPMQRLPGVQAMGGLSQTAHTFKKENGQRIQKKADR